MSDPCRLLGWDSEFFGLRIGRVEGHRLDAGRAQAVAAWAEEQ